jgi:hypothetical protein
MEDEARERASGTRKQYGELTVPYYFSSLASSRGEEIKVGNLVSLIGLSKPYRLTEVFGQFGLCRVHELDGPEGMVLPWRFIRPWRRKPSSGSKTLTQSLGDALYTGSFVYRVDAPEEKLRVKSINWNRESSWVEDVDGNLYELPWDEIEFWEN